MKKKLASPLPVGEIIWEMFREMHGRRGQGRKFEIDDKVKYVGSNFPEYTGKTFVVLAVNSTEYLLGGFPYLVWEEEIEKEKE